MQYAPLFEWISAARWAGMRPDEFFELDGEWQSYVVAAYRTQTTIDAVLAEQQARRIRAKSKRKPTK